MLVTARIAGFLLLFVLGTASFSFSTAYLIQGGDNYEAGKCNLVASERKVTQTISENEIMGRMVVPDCNFMKMEAGKESGERAKYTRKSRRLMSRETYQARFVAFNADYKGPRHHPPKNN